MMPQHPLLQTKLHIPPIRSFMASTVGDVPGSIQSARLSLEVLPEGELEWRSGALLALGDAYASQGQMAAAHQAQSDALVLGKASGDSYYLVIVSLAFAEIFRLQGKLQEVIDICERQFKSAASQPPVAGPAPSLSAGEADASTTMLAAICPRA